ncbi:hypothetical protein [Cupriavidus sp. IK-TO18]|nr:hypothetical protein [Cupriavidus sp. IK-TO18]
MTCQTALLIVATGGVVFAALGVYAMILQMNWMSRPLKESKDNEQ